MFFFGLYATSVIIYTVFLLSSAIRTESVDKLHTRFSKNDPKWTRSQSETIYLISLVICALTPVFNTFAAFALLTQFFQRRFFS